MQYMTEYIILRAIYKIPMWCGYTLGLRKENRAGPVPIPPLTD